jgi:hypothetical protein
MVNSPFALVVVDVVEPFTVTVAPTSGSPVGVRKVPRMFCCAKADKLNKSAREKTALM